ncbi:MAG: polysaccharide deacetylase [Roseburia sp.]|nr:polysaccharide deacetylase [Roseburia sp.]
MKHLHIKSFFGLALFSMLIICGCSSSVSTDFPVFHAQTEAYSTQISDDAERLTTLLPLLVRADHLAQGYYYDEAIELLQNIPDEYTQDEEVLSRISLYQTARDSFVPYEEPVRHIFFHSLIVDTSLAFDGDYMANGYNYWMTTVDEFKAMLEELYANDFILIDIHEIAREETDENGNVKIIANAPMVPKGKKPLVLSVDDVNYYEYMEKDGFARNLMIDENGNVKNLYIDKDGNELIGDYDVAPILDTFVKEHPDFSLRGAKGILALTGYEGTLGYDTHLTDSPTLEEDIQTATAVANRLKETGWLFAIHGYGHRDAKKITYSHLMNDTNRWINDVGSIVGETDIYIYPYGSEIDYPSDKLNYFKSVGLRYFCGVWTKPFVSVKDNYVRQTRCNLDGFNMITRPKSLADLFDVSKVLDPDRPELE